MHGVLVALVAAEEIDPATVRPSPLGSVVLLFLLVATVLLLWSFVRHMRRAQANLGPANSEPVGAVVPGDPGKVEGDSR
jgi:hypothetical protein